ncbi:sulfotransferase family protein [Streptomyces sp. NPDC003247]|uniref:sulfotransferase-like domain-containing protein n=1 Tax=Streptomyces sp. NPDC003247 TaxID=3364677 RepID=UPI0036BB89F1
MTQVPRILALWSAPRSRSTAFLRMMAERGDRTVLHEPFSQLLDFGTTEVAGREVHSESALIAAIREESEKGAVFFKDTTDFWYGELLADTAFLRDATHTFILRHPAEAIASHFALNPNLQRDEIGFARLAEIYDAVHTATGTDPVVIDSADLVTAPAATVRAYCDAVGLPFVPEAVSWDPRMLPDWQRTSRWHEHTGRTTGFTDLATRYEHTVDNHPLLAEYLRFHLPYYQRLYERRTTQKSEATETMTAETMTGSNSLKIDCPACEGVIKHEDDLVVNEIIECGECRSELEVVSVEPLLVALAPEVEEDWGE